MKVTSQLNTLKQMPGKCQCQLLNYFSFITLRFGEAIIFFLFLRIKPPHLQSYFHHPTMLLDVITMFSKNFALIAQLFVCIAKTIYLWSLGQNECIRPLQYRKLSMWALKLTVFARYIEFCFSHFTSLFCFQYAVNGILKLLISYCLNQFLHTKTIKNR